MDLHPDFTIITPSFSQLSFLRMNVASIADQADVTLEHIVQDGGSNDGTIEWLAKQKGLQYFVENDTGMYDALNRGLKKAKGSYLAYLNCDEQYLEGTLSKVKDVFIRNPEIDVLFGDVIVVNVDSTYRCSRKIVAPTVLHTLLSHLPTFTCATFFRRRIIDEWNLFFDTRYRAISDLVWVNDLVRRKAKMTVLQEYLSTFVDTGENLDLIEGTKEIAPIRNQMPKRQRILRRPLILKHRLQKLLRGGYRKHQVNYAIYTKDRLSERTVFSYQSHGRWDARLGR